MVPRVGDDDSIILDCYRLARHYHCSPIEFLNLPITEVQQHVHFTSRLIRERSANNADDDA